MLPRNPCDGVTPPRPEQVEMDVWNAEEAAAFLAATTKHEMHALYALALSTGMRQGELLGLKWNDIDLDAGKLHIHRSLQYQRGSGLVFVLPKTAKSRRPIKLGNRTVDALKAHRKKQLENRLKAGSLWKEQDLVFPTEMGAPHDPSWQYKVFKKAVEDAGLRSIRFHDMRHTAATLLLSKNVHVKVVSEMLGHSSITITLNTYSHFVPSLHDQAADVMDSLLSA
jgi:integrase